MKIRILIFVILIAILKIGYCQNAKPTSQSNKNLDFTSFLSGVKHAYLAIDDKDFSYISSNPSSGNVQAILGILDYLKEIGFSEAKWGTFANTPQNFSSFCDLTIVTASWGYNNGLFTNISISFFSCNGDEFKFISDKNIRASGFTNIRGAFYNACLKMYGYKKSNSSLQRLSLPVEMTEWTEEKLKDYFKNNGTDNIEGIYEGIAQTTEMAKYKIGVIKSENGYNLIYLDGANNFLDWKEGEVKAKLTKTATSNLFKANWKMGNKFENGNTYISFEEGLMNLAMQGREKSVYLKLFPTVDDDINSNKNSITSGTGFGIASNGLIVTNAHVIKSNLKITVRGINGDFSKSYLAKLVTEDKNNDLAIIQVNDPTFTSLGVVPFTIATRAADVGTSVYALGYPLKSVMGDEIKLTNGIISSKSGFKGDVTSYQISVPLQPGNSGGPLFDINGNLVGIVNARLSIGENVSYAIKSSYLINLIDLLAAPPKFQTTNSLLGKPLTEQVKILSRFVYIIEIN